MHHLLGVLLLAFSFSASAVELQYVITRLDPISASAVSNELTDINDQGVVVGYERYLGATSSAVVWDSNGNGAVLQKPTGNSNYRGSRANAINNDGVVVGLVEYGSSSARAVRWENGGYEMLTHSDPNYSGFFMSAYDINSSGVIAGRGIYYGSMAVTYDDASGLNDLGNLLDGTESRAWGMNDTGAVTGYSGANSEAFLWRAETGMVGLGVGESGYSSFGNAVNNSDVVVGYRYSAGITVNTKSSAWYWNEETGMQDLQGLLMGDDSSIYRANDINDSGLVVGSGSITSTLPYVGFALAWYDVESDPVILYDTLVDSTGWSSLVSAEAVNENGDIVGYGVTATGEYAMFKLTAAPVPAAAKCPDISGKWGYQATEVLGGNQFAAIGRGTFRDNGTWTMKLLGALEGEPGELVLRGDYSIDSKCIIAATYAIDDSDEGEGPLTGDMVSIIIDEDKIYMTLTGQPFSSANVIAKRLMSLQ